jgi:hypothetical protein
MRIALCLHGLFDSLTDSSSKGLDGYHHIKKNILNNHNVDIYLHSWNSDKNDEIINLYKPIDFIFEDQVDFTEKINGRNINFLRNSPRPPKNVLSHFYSINKVFNLLYSSTKKYDIVIKSRFDLGRINRDTSGPGKLNPYPVQCINFNQNIISNKLYMANWQHFHMGPPDMWFYGDYNTMENFTTIFEDLDNQFYLNSDFHKFAISIEGNEGDLSNSIAFLKWWMIYKKIWDNKILLDTFWE